MPMKSAKQKAFLEKISSERPEYRLEEFLSTRVLRPLGVSGKTACMSLASELGVIDVDKPPTDALRWDTAVAVLQKLFNVKYAMSVTVMPMEEKTLNGLVKRACDDGFILKSGGRYGTFILLNRTGDLATFNIIMNPSAVFDVMKPTFEVRSVPPSSYVMVSKLLEEFMRDSEVEGLL